MSLASGGRNAEQRLLDLLLERCRESGWLKVRERQRTDSTHILAKIRALNRVLCVAQTMVSVLNVLAEVAPEWVRVSVRSSSLKPIVAPVPIKRLALDKTGAR